MSTTIIFPKNIERLKNAKVLKSFLDKFETKQDVIIKGNIPMKFKRELFDNPKVGTIEVSDDFEKLTSSDSLLIFRSIIYTRELDLNRLMFDFRRKGKEYKNYYFDA